MTTAASLRSYTVKDLAQMAKKLGVQGWSGMRKDDLIRALVRAAKAKAAKSSKAKPKSKTKQAAARRTTSTKQTVVKRTGKTGEKTPAKKKTRVSRRIQSANRDREKKKDLSLPNRNGRQNGKPARPRPPLVVEKDRIVLLVRDPFWLQACWDVSRASVERARAAMAENWHTAKPVLRVFEVDDRNTTTTAERVARNIEIHGGVKNWYIDVQDPPKTYRVDLGYLAATGKFYSLARSNLVTTPRPGSSDAIDENWTDVAENYEKIYALSGGYEEENTGGELQELFEERLRRPMGSPLVTRYGMGAERVLQRENDFLFEVDAEMIIYGMTKPDAHVSLSGDPVKLRPDGTFTIRLSMPDRRQVLPVVASSADGVEQRTIVLAVERNTKVMEPKIRESNS